MENHQADAAYIFSSVFLFIVAKKKTEIGNFVRFIASIFPPNNVDASRGRTWKASQKAVEEWKPETPAALKRTMNINWVIVKLKWNLKQPLRTLPLPALKQTETSTELIQRQRFIDPKTSHSYSHKHTHNEMLFHCYALMHHVMLVFGFSRTFKLSVLVLFFLPRNLLVCVHVKSSLIPHAFRRRGGFSSFTTPVEGSCGYKCILVLSWSMFCFAFERSRNLARTGPMAFNFCIFNVVRTARCTWTAGCNSLRLLSLQKVFQMIPIPDICTHKHSTGRMLYGNHT